MTLTSVMKINRNFWYKFFVITYHFSFSKPVQVHFKLLIRRETCNQWLYKRFTLIILLRPIFGLPRLFQRTCGLYAHRLLRVHGRVVTWLIFLVQVRVSSVLRIKGNKENECIDRYERIYIFLKDKTKFKVHNVKLLH